ncbi:glucoamylase family protein [Acuticoccus kandeliae]|uniref:glucoamylase family protein n=1 Tax=Acuticoccus kandeliae TaxID=2073160 RepID=UPI000D3ECAB5|nr:glucoamylase family protein [Acuticoccus kandeliae]
MTPLAPADADLLDEVQRRTLRYFWDFGHPISGLARDRSNAPAHDPDNDTITIGGTGFALMALIVGAERGFLPRAAVVERIATMLGFLERSDHFHGVFPHFLNGKTGAAIRFSRKDDAADLIETSYLVAGFLAVREYFRGDSPGERLVREKAAYLAREVEWDAHQKPGGNVLMWHWSPNHGFGMNMEVRGWNECLLAYILAVGSDEHGVSPALYHRGWAEGREFRNGHAYYGVELPLGPPFGGPLFFAHYTFLGIDPRGLVDRYADYFAQNVAHVEVNRRHCIENPNGFTGYGADCWGLTASDSDDGYHAHAPTNDRGVISPTAAVSSIPYAPEAAMEAIRRFREIDGVWGEYGFIDAFNLTTGWRAPSFLAIDQGPMIVMIENYRSGLIWRLVMGCPEVRSALERLGFSALALAIA